MIGTHGRDRPVLADDGGVATDERRPLRLSHEKAVLEPPTARSAAVSYLRQGRTKANDDSCISRTPSRTRYLMLENSCVGAILPVRCMFRIKKRE